jgi:DtxR family Mn-dependent transcriptional regulator
LDTIAQIISRPKNVDSRRYTHRVQATVERPRSAAVEDYAKAIYSLTKSGEETASTNDIAARLGVSAGSVSAMLKKLSEAGLVEHVPYRGVQLTGEGQRVALRVLRRHRILELFLAEELGMPWERVHDEAEVLEHGASDELIELIARKLGDPAVDPHGDPIPTRDLTIEEGATEALASLAPGDRARFVRVSDSNPDMLRYLADRGISIGDDVEMIERQPFDGPCSVRFGSETHALGLTLARAMRVAPGGELNR